MPLQLKFSSTQLNNRQYFESNFLSNQYDNLEAITKDEQNGFFHAYRAPHLLSRSKELCQKFKDREVLVHVGIGGSSLGPEMLVNALTNENSPRKIIFINNIDPEKIHEQLAEIEHEKTLFSFVSKSGSTIETSAILNIITNYLFERGVQKNQLKDYYIFTTDPKKSQLKDLAEELNIETLEIPSNIGGRFSVLTPVGIFPALFAGIDAEKILAGAEKIKDHILCPAQENNLLHTASLLYSLSCERGISQTVFMPYSSKLKDLSSWFTQLWAESLGKKYSLSGDIVYRGLTPISAYGATDQHSQMQLFMEGPRDKFILFLEVENFEKDFFMTSPFSTDSSQKLNSYRLGQLMKAEYEGTLKALDQEQVPYTCLTISSITPENLGAIILWLETLTALMGRYLDIDPFDQPGVEAGKSYALKWLSKG